MLIALANGGLRRDSEKPALTVTFSSGNYHDQFAKWQNPDDIPGIARCHWRNLAVQLEYCFRSAVFWPFAELSRRNDLWRPDASWNFFLHGASKRLVDFPTNSRPELSYYRIFDFRSSSDLQQRAYPMIRFQSPYKQYFAATGGTTPYRWSIASGQLSSGLSLNSAAGNDLWRPDASWNFFLHGASKRLVDFRANSHANLSCYRISISISAGLQISTTSLPNGQVRSPYQATLTALGGTQPYTWTASAGTLPAGLKLDSSTGTLSGTPSPVGTFDSDGPGNRCGP